MPSETAPKIIVSSPQSRSSTAVEDSIVLAAFAETADGWSVDEVLLQDAKRQAFVDACLSKLPDRDEKWCNESLIRLRKSGKIDLKATQRNQVKYDQWVHAGEIAARLMYDFHGADMDTVLTDPKLRTEFDRRAAELAPGVDPYLLRKGVLRLRKSRLLRPELVLRVTDWKRDIITLSLAEVQADLSKISTRPGIYLFRDGTGYLYIGQAANLQARLEQHLNAAGSGGLSSYLNLANATAGDAKTNADESQESSPPGDKQTPVNPAPPTQIQLEMHIFQPDSPAEDLTVRRAYESELIRTRNPKLNLAP